MHENTQIANDQPQQDGTVQTGPTVRENVQDELIRLRDDLYRIAHEVRMKSKGAGAEIQDTRRMLEREMKRFSAEVGQAIDRTQRDLLQLGDDLRSRYQHLANQIALPPN